VETHRHGPHNDHPPQSQPQQERHLDVSRQQKSDIRVA
jgi:hypothetical protein